MTAGVFDNEAEMVGTPEGEAGDFTGDRLVSRAAEDVALVAGNLTFEAGAGTPFELAIRGRDPVRVQGPSQERGHRSGDWQIGVDVGESCRRAARREDVYSLGDAVVCDVDVAGRFVDRDTGRAGNDVVA